MQISQVMTSYTRANGLITMVINWVPVLPNIKGISGHLWHFIVMFANGASYAWPRKQINMLALLCGHVKYFSSWQSLKHWNQVDGVWKGVSCHGNTNFKGRRCDSCRTIILLSFDGLRRKLAKNSSIYILDIIFGFVYDVVSRLICIFYPSLELTQTFANGRQRFYSFRKFYVIHLKNQGVRILS